MTRSLRLRGPGAMMILRLKHLLLVSLLGACLGVSWSHAAWGGACAADSVGVSLASGDTSVVTFSCRGVGQTFYAAETLIQSISVWRPARQVVNAIPRYLYITETDEFGIPDTRFLLLDAGPVVNTVGDGVHPVEYRWVFDPPFALPHSGEFFLDIQAEFVTAFVTLAAITRPYANGDGWETGPVFGCARPGGPFPLNPPCDLVFQVRFCAPGSTPVAPTNWGRLKIRYR